MNTKKTVLVLLCALASASSAWASPLNLVLQSHPDITSGLIQVNFNATTHVLTATGTALTLELIGTAPPDFNITSGVFTLNATISTTGAISAATLSITGTIPALTGATSPLLTANLTAFGFGSSPLTQIFEFTGPVTGGSQASRYGATTGVILSLGSGFAGNFTSNVSNGGLGAADTAPLIPAPGAGGLALAAGALALGRRRR